MKRLILGLGVGVFILLCFSTSLQAFDRDINLPSNNQQDPIWIIQNHESDDIGWEEPVTKDGRFINNDRNLTLPFWTSIRSLFPYAIIWHFITDEVSIQDIENRSDTVPQNPVVGR